MEKLEKLLKIIKKLGHDDFSGSLTLNFHRGQISEKIEVKKHVGLSEEVLEGNLVGSST